MSLKRMVAITVIAEAEHRVTDNEDGYNGQITDADFISGYLMGAYSESGAVLVPGLTVIAVTVDDSKAAELDDIVS